MNCGLRQLAKHALVMLIGIGSFALAQEADSMLQSYSLATESLTEALSVLPNDVALSRDALDRAAQTLRPLSRDTASLTLTNALEATFDRAVQAVQNQSQTDLAVQTAVLRGGLQRLLYESALRAANEGDVATARERLTRIAQDMRFSETNLAALNNAETFSTLALVFDRGAAQAAQQYIGEASAQGVAAKDAAYVSLANAYGTFLPVQDSPRAGDTLGASFGQAFTSLIADEAETFGQTLVALIQGLSRFEIAAETALQNGESAAPAASPDIVTAPVTEAIAAPEGTTAASTSEAASVDPVEAGGGSDVAPEAAPSPAATVVPPPLTPDAQATALSRELGGFALDDATLARLSDNYKVAGVESVEEAVAALYAASGRALVAVETGDQTAAKGFIRDYQASYENLLAPLVSGVGQVDANNDALVAGLTRSPSLRLQDAAVLVGHVDSVAEALKGATPASLHNTLLATNLLWSGWTRLLVTLLLGILAFIPLRLLNLAFGGANKNWRLIGIALFLLLLPVIYEGLSSLGDLLAMVTGVQSLATLSVFSIFQNTLSQLVWVVLTAIAIGLAIAGLYGICVQFGLVGKGNANDTVMQTQLTAVPDTAGGDWDEEF